MKKVLLYAFYFFVIYSITIIGIILVKRHYLFNEKDELKEVAPLCIYTPSTTNTLNEKDAWDFFSERGLINDHYPLIYHNNLDGSVDGRYKEYTDDHYHPAYRMFYSAENGIFWEFSLIGDALVADPSYNGDVNGWLPEYHDYVYTLLTEIGIVKIYNEKTNTISEYIVPDNGILMIDEFKYRVIPVGRIDAEFLDNLTLQDINKWYNIWKGKSHS